MSGENMPLSLVYSFRASNVGVNERRTKQCIRNRRFHLNYSKTKANLVLSPLKSCLQIVHNNELKNPQVLAVFGF